MTKTCTKCNEIKDIDLFPNDKTKKDGKRPQCKVCVAKDRKVYNEKNKEKLRQYHKEYHKKNKDKLSEYHKDYLNNGGREVRKKYRQEKKEKIKQLKRHNNALRKQIIKQSELTGQEYSIWINEQIKICAYCGIDCSSEFHVDHIEPLVKGGEHTTSNFTIACPSCNTSKGSQSMLIFMAKQTLQGN